MPRDERLGILDIDRLARFEVENYFMLGAMILEDPTDIFPPGNQIEEAEKDSDADYAVNYVDRDFSLQCRNVVAGHTCQIKRYELIEKNKEGKGEQQVQTHDPGRNLLGLLLALAVVESGIGRKPEGFHAQPHRLSESAHAAQNRELENRVLLGNARERALFDGHFAIRLADRNAVAMRRPHHDALHDGLAADECLLAAFEHRQHLDVRGKAQKTSNGQGRTPVFI